MQSTPHDERERLPRLDQGRGIRTGQQRGEVHAVVRTRAVVSREDLQGDEMAEPSDRYPEPWYDLDRLRRSHDLGFDPGRGEEQIDEWNTNGPPGTGSVNTPSSTSVWKWTFRFRPPPKRWMTVSVPVRPSTVPHRIARWR